MEPLSRWFCYHAVEDGILNWQQCQELIESVIEAGWDLGIKTLAQAIVECELCDDWKQLEQLAQLAVDDTEAMEMPPVIPIEMPDVILADPPTLLSGLVLIFADDDGAERGVSLLPDSYTIGRSDDVCEIVVPERSVSRRHCLIEHGALGWMLEDLDSSFGTTINGRPAKRRQPLYDGDALLLGDVAVMVAIVPWQRPDSADDEDSEDEAIVPVHSPPPRHSSNEVTYRGD